MASSRNPIRTILAIETSCDETALAIADFTGTAKGGARVRVLSHIVSSQVKIHARFGGVVPNLARREHEENLVPILRSTLAEARLLKKSRPLASTSIHRCIEAEQILQREPELLRQFEQSIMPMTPPAIDAIAVTYGPGLAPALWTGVNFARALAHLWGKPLIPTNHMAGHFFSAFLQKSGEENTKYQIPNTKFPILALLVSGGHTELVLVKKPWQFKIIGETQDDAVGEAFDKVGRILGLPYPGGPEIARLAEKGNSKAYALPRPMIHTENYDFSFSGLKTAVLYLVRGLLGNGVSKYLETPFPSIPSGVRADVAASFQKATIDVLVRKTIRAAKEYKVKTLALGGGVAANAALRAGLSSALKNVLPKAECRMPEAALAGDNALMIAAAAYFCGKKGSPETDLRADANARLGENPHHNRYG